jgi:hypothetical protein
MLQVIGVGAAIAALAGGTAAAQQPPDNGDSAPGRIAIFRNMQPEPDGMNVKINGREIDDLRSLTYDDVTSFIHPGTNTLTVAWSGPVQGLNFKVDYEPTRNRYEDVLVVRADASSDASLGQAGSRTETFTIPG